MDVWYEFMSCKEFMAKCFDVFLVASTGYIDGVCFSIKADVSHSVIVPFQVYFYHALLVSVKGGFGGFLSPPCV